MDDCLPQEIEVRYIIPAIRGKLAHILVEEKGVSQKQASKILGLTEAAISQYINGKRGTEVMFSESVVEEIRKSAGRVVGLKTNKGEIVAEIYRICHLTNVKHIMCDMHRKQSKGLDDCTICFDEEELVQIKNVR